MKTYLLAKTYISETEISLVMRQFLKVEKKFNGNFLALKVINHEPQESDKLKGADVECTCENIKEANVWLIRNRRRSGSTFAETCALV